MYRDEFAAIPSENLASLISRGRELRVQRDQELERARQEEIRAQQELAAWREIAEEQARAARLEAACQRRNLLRGLWVTPVVVSTVMMCVLPGLILSASFRAIALPIGALGLAWPLFAYLAHRFVNRGSVAAEQRWLAERPFQLHGHLEALGSELEREIKMSVELVGLAPETAIVADLVAGFAETRDGLARELLERTAVVASGNTIELTLRVVDSRGRNVQYRLWSHAIADLLAEMGAQFPAVAARVSGSSS